MAPGNAGIAKEFECLDNKNYLEICEKIRPDLVVVGPENFLVDGLSDLLRDNDFKVLGPNQYCAQLEGSKAFMKEVCSRAGVKTAGYDVCENLEQIEIALDRYNNNFFVLKADGLCGGKGVEILGSKELAQESASKLFKKFGKASQKIIVEEFLSGQELSVIGLCDGTTAKIFPGVRDHKRLLDNDEGPNTGGMGVIGPLSDEGIGVANWQNKARLEIFEPILAEMKRRGKPYRGLMYAGLMIDSHKKEFNLLEINIRFGDPEAQNILFGLKNNQDFDLLEDFLEISENKSLEYKNKDDLNYKNMSPTCTVVMAAEGYPENPKTGQKIGFKDKLDKNNKIFYAGVKTPDQVRGDRDFQVRGDGGLETAGGRVLSLNTHGNSLSDAREACYKAVSNVYFDNAHYRKDIGETGE